MKYVILIYHNPESQQMWESFSHDEQAAGFAAYAALNETLSASGELVVTEALADVDRAKRVRRTETGVVTSDGPFAEAKEHLAGFYLVECATEDRAIEIAGQIPEADLGMIEVRPVMDLSGFEM